MASVHLTPKQQAFVREYLIDYNATQAAIRAGYSPNTARVTACKMLTKANIQSRLGELERKAAAFAEKKAEDVRARLVAIAWTDLADIVDFDGQVMTCKSFQSLTPAQRACIKDWKARTVTRMGSAGEPIKVDMVEIKLHDKLKALELYARYIGMDRESRREALPTFNITMVMDGKKQDDRKPTALPPLTNSSRP